LIELDSKRCHIVGINDNELCFINQNNILFLKMTFECNMNSKGFCFSLRLINRFFMSRFI